MITNKDQEELFTLISKLLTQDVTGYAFGGNAMMYYGYKDETKDVDILFETEEERSEFFRILRDLGYKETSPITIYIPEKLKDKRKPLMFKHDNGGRFDLFVEKIFQTLLSPQMKENVFAVHEFKGKHTLLVKVLRKEHIVLLKAVTDRENDFRDIRTIISQDKSFDWQYFIEEVRWQYGHGDGWVLLGVEKTMQELKEYVFIPEKWFKELYEIGKMKSHKK
ncbi:hypothetical protein HYU22_04975 [Candidatus Woesearchaeota archaeon]|nr:hypothetical protein [Candidatus Woesearchaeota archaeon]